MYFSQKGQISQKETSPSGTRAEPSGTYSITGATKFSIAFLRIGWWITKWISGSVFLDIATQFSLQIINEMLLKVLNAYEEKHNTD